MNQYCLSDGYPLVVREAKEEDAGALVQYIEKASAESDFLTFGPGEFGVSETEQRSLLKSYKESYNGLFLVATINDKIVGTLTFTTGRRPRIIHYGEVGMSVDKNHWGSGIGSILIDHVLEWAKAKGTIRKINLGVRTDNLRAIRLYLKKGFIVEGTIRKGICINGQYFDHYCMGILID